MLPIIIIILVVCAFVVIGRYHEIPVSRRPSFLHWLLRRKHRYPLDENAKKFAEQWSKHPTLSRRRAYARQRELRKRNRG